MNTIPLSRAGANPATAVAIVDDDVADMLRRKGFKLTITRKGYVSVRITLHRLVMGIPTVPGNVIDHINGNRMDNRRANLREVTSFQNMQNCGNERKKNRLGLRGVIDNGDGRYGARGAVNGRKLRSKGAFESPREAHAAYLRLVIDAGSLLPESADDIDRSVLAEFPERMPTRRRKHTLPTGVEPCGKKFRASLRREKVHVHLGGAHPTVEAAAFAVAQGQAAYMEGGLAALQDLAKEIAAT